MKTFNVLEAATTTPEVAILNGGMTLKLRCERETSEFSVVLYYPAGMQNFPDVWRFGTDERRARKWFNSTQARYGLIGSSTDAPKAE